MVPWHAGRGLGKMWQNVLKISPLFCGKIFKIFCHGLPAGGGQLFRTSTIFLPLLTPTFRQTPVNDSRHCVKFYCSARVTALCFAPGISPVVCRAYRQPLLRRLPAGQDGVIPVPTFGPGGTGRRGRARGTQVGGSKSCGKMFRKSSCFSAERFSKSFATVCPRGNDNRKALRFSFPS